MYPKWFVVATVLAVSVAVSTMYLGIHWLIDVLAGIALAHASVALAGQFVGRWSLSERLNGRVPAVSDTGDDNAPQEAHSSDRSGSHSAHNRE